MEVQTTAVIVMGQTLIIYWPHAVPTILNNRRTHTVTTARWTRWEATLLAPGIEICKESLWNVSQFLPHTQKPGFWEHHRAAVMQQAWRDGGVSEQPLPISDLVLYVNGSCYAVDGNRASRYAVCDDNRVVKQGSLPPSRSAQAAELVDLTEVSKIGEGSHGTHRL